MAKKKAIKKKTAKSKSAKKKAATKAKAAKPKAAKVAVRAPSAEQALYNGAAVPKRDFNAAMKKQLTAMESAKASPSRYQMGGKQLTKKKFGAAVRKKTKAKPPKKVRRAAKKGRAGTIARWGKGKNSYKWRVTKSQMQMFDSLSISDEWSSDYRKRDRLEFTVDFYYARELHTKLSMYKRLKWWKEHIGKTGAFYVGKNSLCGCGKFRLVGMDVSDVRIAGKKMVFAKVSLRFQEVRKELDKIDKKSKKKTGRTTRKKSSKKK